MVCPSARGKYSVVGNEQQPGVMMCRGKEKKHNNKTVPLPANPLSSFHFPSVPHSPAVHIISYTLASPLSSPELNIFCNNRAKRCILCSSQITKEQLSRGTFEYKRRKCLICCCHVRMFFQFFLFRFCVFCQNVNLGWLSHT